MLGFRDHKIMNWSTFQKSTLISACGQRWKATKMNPEGNVGFVVQGICMASKGNHGVEFRTETQVNSSNKAIWVICYT